MSGSNGDRGDRNSGGGSGGGGGVGGLGGAGGKVDPCSLPRFGPINSPKANVLQGVKVEDVLDVEVDDTGRSRVLVVKHNGQVAGSLTFNGYLVVIDCIMVNGVVFKATVLNIAGGVYEVRVEPI